MSILQNLKKNKSLFIEFKNQIDLEFNKDLKKIIIKENNYNKIKCIFALNDTIIEKFNLNFFNIYPNKWNHFLLVLKKRIRYKLDFYETNKIFPICIQDIFPNIIILKNNLKPISNIIDNLLIFAEYISIDNKKLIENQYKKAIEFCISTNYKNCLILQQNSLISKNYMDILNDIMNLLNENNINKKINNWNLFILGFNQNIKKISKQTEINLFDSKKNIKINSFVIKNNIYNLFLQKINKYEKINSICNSFQKKNCIILNKPLFCLNEENKVSNNNFIPINCNNYKNYDNKEENFNNNQQNFNNNQQKLNNN